MGGEPERHGHQGFILVLSQGELPPELVRGLETKIDGQPMPTGWPDDVQRHEAPGVGIAAWRRFYTVTGETVPGHKGTWVPVPIEELVALVIGLAPDRAGGVAGNGAVELPQVAVTNATMTAELLERIESDPWLARRWFNTDRNADRSGNDFRLAQDMADRGYAVEEMEAALRAYPYGQISRGDLAPHAVDRQVGRCIGKGLLLAEERRRLVDEIVQRLRAKRRRGAPGTPELEPWITAAEALERIRGAIGEFIAAPDHVRDLGIKVTPGAGKTRTIIASLPDGCTALILTPTIKLAEEGAAYARSIGLPARVFYGKSQPGMCPKGAAANALGNLGLSSARHMCGRLGFDKHGNEYESCELRECCAWWQQHDDFSGQITFASAKYFAFANDIWPEFDIIVIDEKFIGAITDSMLIAVDHIISPARFSKLGSKRDEADRAMTSRLLDLRDIIASDESVWDYFTAKELSALAHAQRELIESYAPRPGCSASDAEHAAELIRAGRYHERATLLELLAEGHGRPGLGERVTWNQEPEEEFEIAHKKKSKLRRLRLHIRNERQVRGKKLIVSDADLDPILMRYLYLDLNVLDFSVKLRAKIFQLPGSYTRKTLLGWYRRPDNDLPYRFSGESLLDSAMARRRLERDIARICADGRPTLVVALRDLIAPDPERPPPPFGYEPLVLPQGCKVAWFGGTLGLNSWAGCHRVIVVGQPNVPAVEVESKARALGGNWPTVELSLPGKFGSAQIMLADTRGRKVAADVAVPVDDVVAAMRQQFEEAEVWQGANRGRFVHPRRTPGEIVIFGKVQLPQQPDAIVLPRELGRPSRAEQAIDRFGIAPLSARELAEALGVKVRAITASRLGKRVHESPYKEPSTYKADLLPFPDAPSGPEIEPEVSAFTGDKPIFHGLSEELFGVLSPLRFGPLTMVSYRRAGQSGRGSPHKAASPGKMDAAEALARLEGIFGAGEVHDVTVLGVFGAVSGSGRANGRASARSSGVARMAA